MWIGRQVGSTGEERSRRRIAATLLCTLCRPLEIGGDPLIRGACGLGEMPGPSVWIGRAVGRSRKRAMGVVPVCFGCLPVRRGADEWMHELDAPADAEEPG